MSKKPKIGDRRKSAMSAQVEEETAPLETPKATPQAETSAKSPTKTTGATPKAKAAPKSSNASDTTRLGIYITPEEYDAAKSAYLADWQHGGQADTFTKWIGAALEAHAARSTTERARLARHGGRSESRTGASRSFNVPSDTGDRMRAAINEDQAAGRWPSDSAWGGDAIAAAVDRAREQAGGVLPQAPARLPNRLRR